MEVPLEYAMGTLRFSVGRFTNAGKVDQAVVEIAQAVGAPAGRVGQPN
jgi:cysteine sulfinate desulfinase/cysteine desulfurase-like protein